VYNCRYLEAKKGSHVHHAGHGLISDLRIELLENPPKALLNAGGIVK